MGYDLPCKTGCENTSNKNITSQKKLIESSIRSLYTLFLSKPFPNFWHYH